MKPPITDYDIDEGTSAIDAELTSLCKVVDSHTTIEEYLALDEKLCTHDDDADSISSSNVTTVDDDSEEEEPEEEISRIRNIDEALQASKEIRSYLLTPELRSSSVFSTAMKLENDLLDEKIFKQHSGRQTLLSDIFRRK